MRLVVFRASVKKYCGAVLLLLGSTLVCLALGEAIVRIIMEPGDYLRARLEKDLVLAYRIRPNSAGHDAWGFRNRGVPESAKIVTIGDSQTYGIAAAASNSWPRHLERMTGRKFTI